MNEEMKELLEELEQNADEADKEAIHELELLEDLPDAEEEDIRMDILKKYMQDEDWYHRMEKVIYASYNQAKQDKQAGEDYLKNDARNLILNKYMKDADYYARAESYIYKKFDKKLVRHQATQEKKKAKAPSALMKKIQPALDWFGDSLIDYFFFLFNIVLSIWNFWSLKGALSVWYGSMGVYYLLLGFLRFMILEPKPWPVNGVHVNEFWIRKVSSYVFYLLGGILPFILFFSLTYFNHAKNSPVLILVFLMYTFFKLSAFFAKFVTSAMRDISAFTPLSCINHVELLMAVLTVGRYWLGLSGDDSYGFVLFLNITFGAFSILAVLCLGVYSSLQAKELKRIMDMKRWSRADLSEARTRIKEKRQSKKKAAQQAGDEPETSVLLEN